MKKALFSIFLLFGLLYASSIENGIGVYFNIGAGFDTRDINNDKSSLNFSYGVGAILYNVDENKLYYGVKAGGDFGKVDFKEKRDFNTLKIQGEIGYRVFPKEKGDIYFILGYEKFNVKYSLTSRNYTGFGIGLGAAKTINELFRAFIDLTSFSVENDSIDDTINDTRLNIGLIIKD